MNVVSLLPSATEILYALGVEPVGMSHECDYPPAARDRPAVTVSRVDTEGDDCAAVDRAVREAVDDGEGAYAIDVETLDALDPDLIVTQGICDVCAVDTVLVEAAVERIGASPTVLTTDPHHLTDVLDDIERIGAAVDRPDRAADVRSGLEARVERVENRAAAETDAARPTVAVLDWLDPVMVAGHWVPGLIERAGGRYPLADPGDRSTPREWGAIRDCDPEVLIAAPCGFDRDRTREAADALADRPGWDDLRAVPGRAHAVDGSGLVNRPGPRLVDTLETFAALLHPNAFDAPDRAAPLRQRTAAN